MDATALIAIPLGALIVSLAALIFTGMGVRHRDLEKVEARLAATEARLERAERKLAVCEAARDDLRSENLGLLQRLVAVEQKVKGA